MTKEKSAELRLKNNCATCKRRGKFAIGCQVFTEEPENCWAHTTDPDWLKKVQKEVKHYKETRLISE